MCNVQSCKLITHCARFNALVPGTPLCNDIHSGISLEIRSTSSKYECVTDKEKKTLHFFPRMIYPLKTRSTINHHKTLESRADCGCSAAHGTWLSVVMTRCVTIDNNSVVFKMAVFCSNEFVTVRAAHLNVQLKQIGDTQIINAGDLDMGLRQ